MDDPVSAVERTLQDVVALAAEAQALPPGAEQKLTTALLHDRDALREACVLLAHILVSSMDSQVGGAPTGNINFELCQACFTAVVRILTALGSADWAVEEVLGLLESVHEVYDVVLTCAETYEWAMPGATGPLRLYMLQVIAVCFGHERLTGRSLMELLSMDTTAAVSLLTYILRCRDPDCGFELQEVAARCLMELTTADAVFVPDEDDRTNDQQIAELTVSLNRHTNSMIQGIVQFDAVDAFGRCICQHQESHSHTDVLVKAFLGMIHNSLLYCSSNQKNLRSHLSIRSTIVQDIMIPYVENILPALYEAPQVTPQMIEFQNLAATMQTFVIVTFNLNLFRAQFLHTDILARCMEVPTALQSFRMLEIMIKLHVNVDFVTSPYFERARDLLLNAVLALPTESRARLSRKLKKPSHGLPVTKANPQSAQALSAAFDPEGISVDLVAAEPVDGEEEVAGGFFGMQWDTADAAQETAALLNGYESLPDHALCELSGGLMADPVCTPEGHYYDRPMLEQWVAEHGTDPMTGNGLHMGQCYSAVGVQDSIAQYQSSKIAEQALGVAPAPAAAPVEAAPVPPKPSGPLGDLPSLGPAPADTGDKQKGKKIKIKRNNVTECPDEFKCMIDGKIMTHPLRSPAGHTFEQTTLDKWFASCGSVCPITYEVLQQDACVHDKELQKRIVKWFKETNGLAA